MALNDHEKLLVEAIGSMLQNNDVKLGLAMHTQDQNSTERGYEYLHNQIDEMFALKAAELVHAESVNRAFHKVHSYKYLDDPSFKTAMEKEMVAQAVPAEERKKATDFISKIMNEVKAEQEEWCEKDSGFNPALDEIIDLSRPEQPLDFSIEKVEGWPMESNVEWDKEDFSPSKTPSEPVTEGMRRSRSLVCPRCKASGAKIISAEHGRTPDEDAYEAFCDMCDNTWYVHGSSVLGLDLSHLGGQDDSIEQDDIGL